MMVLDDDEPPPPESPHEQSSVDAATAAATLRLALEVSRLAGTPAEELQSLPLEALRMRRDEAQRQLLCGELEYRPLPLVAFSAPLVVGFGLNSAVANFPVDWATRVLERVVQKNLYSKREATKRSTSRGVESGALQFRCVLFPTRACYMRPTKHLAKLEPRLLALLTGRATEPTVTPTIR